MIINSIIDVINNFPPSTKGFFSIMINIYLDIFIVMSKRFVLTESEKNEIKRLYGLLNEQEVTPLVIQGSDYFENGKYKKFSQETKTTIDSELQKAAKYVQDNKGSVVYVKIVAGESQVTNYDKEINPQKQVESGYLSNKRAEMMKDYLLNYFQGLVDKKILDRLPIFEAFETVIGKNTYQQGKDNPDDPKYAPERFVRIELAIKPASACIVGLTITVLYNPNKDPKYPCRGNHKCDRANFDVLLNNVKIGAANLNNLNDGGFRTSGPLQVTDDLAKQIMGDTPKNIVIQLQCKSDNCHSDRPEVLIKKGSTVLFSGCAPAKSERNDNSLMTILTLDPCGNLIPSLNQSDPNVKVVDETSAKTSTDSAKFNQSEAIVLFVDGIYTPDQSAKYYTDNGDMYLAATGKDGVKYYKANRNFKFGQKEYSKGKFYYFKK
jgi:hypothetical protein